jgi:ABC-type thiamine transport system ATPase subunit
MMPISCHSEPFAALEGKLREESALLADQTAIKADSSSLRSSE